MRRHKPPLLFRGPVPIERPVERVPGRCINS